MQLATFASMTKYVTYIGHFHQRNDRNEAAIGGIHDREHLGFVGAGQDITVSNCGDCYNGKVKEVSAGPRLQSKLVLARTASCGGAQSLTSSKR